MIEKYKVIIVKDGTYNTLEELGVYVREITPFNRRMVFNEVREIYADKVEVWKNKGYEIEIILNRVTVA